MARIRTQKEWFQLVDEFNKSNINLTEWCRRNSISKGTFYKYLKDYKNESSKEQAWGEISIPRNIENKSISMKIGAISLEIKDGFSKALLEDILKVVINL